MDAARSDGIRASLREALAKGLDHAGDLTWDRVVANFSGQEAAKLFRSILGGERGQGWIENALTTTAGNLLDRPIGRPADWLGLEETDQVMTAMTSSAWGWVQGQIPMVASRLNIPEMVEQKIIGFPLPLLEDIIRRVIGKELKLIVQLGWVLGAVVGLMTFAISYAVR